MHEFFLPQEIQHRVKQKGFRNIDFWKSYNVDMHDQRCINRTVANVDQNTDFGVGGRKANR